MNKILLERVNKENCPICNKKLGTDITFVDYNGTKQPVHKKHIKFNEKN